VSIQDPLKLRQQAEMLIRQAEELEAAAEPGGPGTAIMFRHQYAKGGKIYVHLAFRTESGWLTTAEMTSRAAGWATLRSRFPELERGRYAICADWELKGDWWSEFGFWEALQ
jgi:hypothetical protein